VFWLLLRKRRADGAADIEAPACAAQVALLPRAAIAVHLIFRVEAVAAGQACAKAKRHAGVIGPLARLQVKRTAAYHVSEWPERAGRLEFQCGAKPVTGG
jgi:hypothetical protein